MQIFVRGGGLVQKDLTRWSSHGPYQPLQYGFNPFYVENGNEFFFFFGRKMAMTWT